MRLRAQDCDEERSGRWVSYEPLRKVDPRLALPCSALLATVAIVAVGSRERERRRDTCERRCESGRKRERERTKEREKERGRAHDTSTSEKARHR